MIYSSMSNLPIKDLSGYLKYARSNGQDMNDIPVVDMGQIVVTRINWFRRVVVVSSLVLFLGIGLTAYNKNYTINVSGSDPRDIITYNDAIIYSVEQVEDNYRIKLLSFKNINNLIKKLRDKQIKVELEK